MPIKSFFARHAARRSFFPRMRRSQLPSRMVIRKPLSWQRRALLGALIAGVALVAGGGLFLAGQYSAGYNGPTSSRRIAELERDNADLRARNGELTANLNSATTQLNIELGAHKSMEAQILKLEDERNRLSRDLALFDNLFPNTGADGQATIRGFRVEPASTAGNPAAWRYRLLIMRAGRTRGSFTGEAQLQVRYRIGGQERLADTPASGMITEPLEFERYQRIEGQFQAPTGAKLLGAVARVMENGKLVAESIYRP